jgi:transporter family protein
MASPTGWFHRKILSAVFATLAAIFTKIGIQGIDSNLATFLRVAIIIVVLSVFVAYMGRRTNPFELSSKWSGAIGYSGKRR